MFPRPTLQPPVINFVVLQPQNSGSMIDWLNSIEELAADNGFVAHKISQITNGDNGAIWLQLTGRFEGGEVTIFVSANNELPYACFPSSRTLHFMAIEVPCVQHCAPVCNCHESSPVISKLNEFTTALRQRHPQFARDTPLVSQRQWDGPGDLNDHIDN